MQFSVVSEPDTVATDDENWLSFRVSRSLRPVQETPVKRVGINLGGVADRYVREDDMLWTHHPAVGRNLEAPPLVPVTYRGAARNRYHHSAQMTTAGRAYRSWVSASQVTGQDGLTIHLATPLVAPQTVSPPLVDGHLDDGCWDGQHQVGMDVSGGIYKSYLHTLPSSSSNCQQGCYAMLRYDDTNLYIAGGAHGYLSCDAYMTIAVRSREGRAVYKYNSSTYEDTVVLVCGYKGKASYGVDTNDWEAAYLTDTDGQNFSAEMAIPWAML
jgi:hypothetical protein